jgi:hypothetical protein
MLWDVSFPHSQLPTAEVTSAALLCAANQRLRRALFSLMGTHQRIFVETKSFIPKQTLLRKLFLGYSSYCIVPSSSDFIFFSNIYIQENE